MQEKINRKKTFDWTARVLLTLQVLAIISGYFNYLQLLQLDSPLIPKSTISTIMLDTAGLVIYRSIYMGLAFIISLWLYFFRKYMLCLIVSGLALAGYILYSYLWV